MCNLRNCTYILTKSSREIRGTSCVIYSSIQHTALKWMSGTGYDDNNFFFKYGLVNLFILVMSHLKYSCTVSDTLLHQHPVARPFLE